MSPIFRSKVYWFKIASNKRRIPDNTGEITSIRTNVIEYIHL